MSIELFDNLVMLKVVMGGTEIFREKVQWYSVVVPCSLHMAFAPPKKQEFARRA